MGRKTPPFPNYPKWTTARFYAFLRSSLRQAWNKYPPKYEALKSAEIGRIRNKKTGKLCKHYKCAECGGIFPAKDVQVDHIVDVGTLKSFDDLKGFAERMFCSSKGLRVLCRQCHNNKTYNK